MTDRPKQRQSRTGGEHHAAPMTASTLVTAHGRARGQTDMAHLAPAEEAAHGAAPWQARVLAGLPDALIVTDREGRITEWNSAAERTYGYTREEMLGETTARMHPEGDAPARPQSTHDSLAESGSWSGKMTYQRKDGTRVVCETTVSPLLDERGEPIGAFSLNREIAARTQAEEAAAHLAAIVTSADDAIASKTLDGIVTSWNASAERMFGYTAEEMIGQPILRLFPPDRLKEEDYILARIRAGERVEHFETVRQTKDGRLLEVALTISPIRDSAGTIIGASKIVRNITERKRLEADAQRQAALLALSFEAILAWTADGVVVEWNAGAEHVYGYSRAEALGRTIHDLLHTVHPASKEAVLDALANTGQWTGELRHTAKDGHEVIVESRQQVIDVNGQRLVLESNRDITERKRLEAERDRLLGEERQARAAAEAAEAQLRAVLTMLPVGASIVDAAGRAVLVNDAVRQIWGQSLHLAERKEEYGEYKAWRAATGEPLAGDEWGVARALTRGEVTAGNEYDIETFDGQRKTILDSAAPIRDEHGAIVGAASVIVDITERRELERRTREALEAFIAITQALVAAPDEAAEAHDTRRIGEAAPAEVMGAVGPAAHPRGPASASPLARRLVELTRGILGCSRVAITSVEEVDGRLYDWPVAIVGMTPEQERHWWETELAARPREVGVGLLPEDLDRLLRGEVLTLDLTRPPYEVPNEYGVTALLFTAMRTQGQIVGFLAFDFEDASGKPHVFTPEEIQIAQSVARLGAVVLERDRLLRERAEAQARELAAVEAARRMDEFLSIASHELRTPLTTVKANLQLAERRAERLAGEPQALGAKGTTTLEQLRSLLERAVAALGRQERLVQDLLDVSRIAAGKLEYRIEPTDLAALVREVAEEQRLIDPSRALSVSVPRADVSIDADADRIRQVLANYLTNALKYSPPDQPVDVTLRRVGTMARVEVRDQGPGLTAEQQEHLFERFYRVPGIKQQSGSGVGLGLGLYICQTIVERHGGQVGVESAPGQGSTFWFTLPLANTGGKE